MLDVARSNSTDKALTIQISVSLLQDEIWIDRARPVEKRRETKANEGASCPLDTKDAR
jgi:hypothetical protein